MLLIGLVVGFILGFAATCVHVNWLCDMAGITFDDFCWKVSDGLEKKLHEDVEVDEVKVHRNGKIIDVDFSEMR